MDWFLETNFRYVFHLNKSFELNNPKDDPATTTTLFGFLMLSRGLGNILSTPVSTSLTQTSGTYNVLDHFKTGFGVEGNKYEYLIIYVGTCFAGAAGLALSGWLGRD